MDQGNELDELINLLDCDGFEEESNNEGSTQVEESLALFNEVNKSNITNKISTFEHTNHLNNEKKNEIHSGDIDSSDDEDNQYAGDHQKYSVVGQAIKNSLKKSSSLDTFFESRSSSWKSKKASNPENQQIKTLTQTVAPVKTPKDVFSDPFFGIRIITPLVSSQSIKEKMLGKKAVTFEKLEQHLTTYDKTSDWVLAGVILSKIIRTSQKGNPYVCWTLSDLREELKTVSVFLFGKAYKDLWKTNTHTVVAILNASPLENSSKKSIAKLSVLSSEQVMIWGLSKDLGVCKAQKNNGEPCTAFVNTSQCAFCVHHVKQEYHRFTGRSELHTGSGGSLSRLHNKVLVKPSQKQKMKDQKRLTDLFSSCERRLGPSSQQSKQLISQLQSSRVMLNKDAETLQKLTGPPATLADVGLPSLTTTSSNTASKISSKASSKPLLNQPNRTENSTITSSACKIEKNNSETRFEQTTKHTEMLYKPSITKPSLNAHVSIQSSKSFKRISSQAHFPNTNKEVPTKNRFNNLKQLKSLCGSSNELKKESDSTEKANEQNRFTANKRDEKFICNSNHLKGIDMFDVSFDFGVQNKSKENKCSVFIVEENSKQPGNIAQSCKTKETQDSNVPSSKCSLVAIDQSCDILHNSDLFISHDAGLSPRTNNSLSLSTNHFLSQLNKSHSIKTPLTKPLSETKLPTNYVCLENNKEKYSNLKTKVQKNGKNENINDVCLSPEIPLIRLKDVVHTDSPKQPAFPNLSLTVPVCQSSAKAKAIKYVREKGPLKKEDRKSTKFNGFTHQKRRMQEEEGENSTAKKTTLSKRFAELIKATSAHTDLVSKAEDEANDEYYDKMEKKEKIEEKMLSTFKIDCKAYSCLKCKYKWFTPSDLCKSEGHPLKVVSAVKRFFQCHNCKKRTVSLDMIPLHNCKNCGQASWDRAPMMRERKMTTTHLSIRGGEQKFYNSVVTDMNLDLAIPDD